MKKRLHPLRLALHLSIGTLLSISVFFSTSFLTYLADRDTFNKFMTRTNFDVDIGFPFTYYAEKFNKGNSFPSTATYEFNFLLDCALTWCLIALPYVIYRVRISKVKNKRIANELLDQKEI